MGPRLNMASLPASAAAIITSFLNHTTPSSAGNPAPSHAWGKFHVFPVTGSRPGHIPFSLCRDLHCQFYSAIPAASFLPACSTHPGRGFHLFNYGCIILIGIHGFETDPGFNISAAPVAVDKADRNIQCPYSDFCRNNIQWLRTRLHSFQCRVSHFASLVFSSGLMLIFFGT